MPADLDRREFVKLTGTAAFGIAAAPSRKAADVFGEQPAAGSLEFPSDF
jgi:hypothetical protein